MGDALENSDRNSETAYELLLALLEYQLSSPVQWIATQATLHESQPQGQRYIEIGPGDTLRSMLTKTLAQYPDYSHDHVSACLTFGEELEESQETKEAEPAESESNGSKPAPRPPAEHHPVAQPQPCAVAVQPQPPPRKMAEVGDAPPSATEALLAIIASGLRVPKSSVDMTRSVKFLANGRSALQNEIIGNLAAEFGQLPDAVEDKAVIELGMELQRTFSGRLGKYLVAWLPKKVAAKLAPSLTVSKIRAYLRDVFGLREGRQSSFFLTAEFDEIPSRIADDEGSWQVVNRWASAYVKDRGIEQAAGTTDLLDRTAGGETGAPQEAVMTSPQLGKFGRELADLVAKHFASGDGSHAVPQVPEPQQGMDEPTELDTSQLAEELGHDFIRGTQCIFKPEMVYRYQSSWNWAVQDLYVTMSDIISRAQEGDEQEDPHLLPDWVDSACQRLRTRLTDRMRRCAEYLLAKWEGQSPTSPGRDHCVLLLRGVLQKDKVCGVAAAAAGVHSSGFATPNRSTVPRTTITETGDIIYEEVPVAEAHGASRDSEASWDRLESNETASSATSGASGTTRPRLLTRSPRGDAWEVNVELTAQLHEAERRLSIEPELGRYGTTLIIGAGQQSIGFRLAGRLLEAGCRVALCTTRLTLASRKAAAQLFAEAARPGAELVLLPFNQGSVRDVHAMVEYVNNTLGWEIDHLVPFAAVAEPGRTIQDLDSLSELAHRVMLTNTLRLMGSIATSKQRRHVLNHSTQVLVPLSPNHGQFSKDGLYAESKLGLEALANKWATEPWSDQLSISAVRIGWTRGTAIMAGNDVFAEEMEKLGVRTFSAPEMATLLTLVMSPDLAEACTRQPILYDLSGGLQSVANIADIRRSIQNTVSVRRQLRGGESETGNTIGKLGPAAASMERRAGFHNSFPVLPERKEDAFDGGKPQALVLDLDSTVVIVGFAELGSAGSSRTRWELEAYGEFSLEGCIELAWMTGLISYARHRVHEGRDLGPGWIVCETGEPIREMDVKSKFEDRIHEHTGIRILDPGEGNNPDPRLRNMLHEVNAQEDLAPFECPLEAAEALKARHGDAVEVLGGNGVTATARIRHGASFFVPKAMNTAFFVGAQVPTGWDPARYGIPPEVLSQADRPSLYALVCAVEAFLSAGITDVYELYRYVHASEVGNCLGSGAGGGTAIQTFTQQRLLGKDVRSDILSEAFVGTAAAWVNMLLLSASGPIKTGAGACATSLESLDTACDLIASGRAKVCLAGGHDVFTHPMFYEFGEMMAIGNAASEARSGRQPSEMSRPFTSTRGGFALGEGIGMQVVCSAALALEMGLPIYGVVAMTHMAADGLGRSVPAPGCGVLTAARQVNGASGMSSALLDPSLRAQRIRSSLACAERRGEDDEAAVRAEAQRVGCTPAETEARVQSTREGMRLERKAILRALGHSYWVGHPNISPIVGALSVFGLGVDDITFASLHGTGTRLNDVNECATLDLQMRHLGRHAGNPLLTIAQKSVVGHGLGASGAWAVNGALQAMHAGLIPGNRNADDIDKALEPFERLLLSNKNIAVRPEDMKAFSVTSFGFGQKGAQALVVHPRYLYAAISDKQYQVYRAKRMARAPVVSRALDRTLHGQPSFQAKDEVAYVGDEHSYLLNPLARTA